MNTLTIRSERFNDPACLGTCLGNWVSQLGDLGYDNVSLAADPGVLVLRTNDPIELGLLIYVADSMQGIEYTAELSCTTGPVPLRLR